MNVAKFFNELFGELDVFEEGGELLFYGVKVATILGYQNPGKAVLDHVDKNDCKALKYKAFPKTEKAFRMLWEDPHDYMEKTLINEAGLYSLVFSSKLERAVEFRNWVTHTVLPSIRKNGGYILGQEELPDRDRSDMEETIRNLSAKIKFLRKRRKELRQDILAVKDKVRSLKKEKNALEEYCDLYEGMYENLMKEYQNLSRKTAPKNNTEPARQRIVITDSYGMVEDIRWTA